jgi:GNAT superfamily N-acetyltransferase
VARVDVAILCGTSTVGAMQALVIDRNLHPRWNFHTLCDSLSPELQRLSFECCDYAGRLRYAEFDGLTDAKNSDTSAGGFLYIEHVSVDPEHRSKGLGLRCVNNILQFLNVWDKGEDFRWFQRRMDNPAVYRPRLRYNRTNAVISPGPQSEIGAGMHTGHPSHAGGTQDQSEAAAPCSAGHTAQTEAAVTAQQKSRARYWARLGFQQASLGSEFGYLIPSRLCFESNRAVACVPVTKLPKWPFLAAEDVPLREYVLGCKTSGPPPTFKVDVRGHVERDANLKRMNALHLALQCGTTTQTHYRLLVDLGADLNGVDALGAT